MPVAEKGSSVASVVYELARRANEKHSHPKQARACLTRWIIARCENPDFQTAFVDWALREALGNACYETRHAANNTRCRAKTETGYGERKVNKEGDDAHERAARQRLMDTYTLDNGMVIGDATGREVGQCADRMRKQADGAAFKAVFLQAVSDHVPAAQKVRKSLTEDQMVKIMQQAKGTKLKLKQAA
jgi:hypothetical protein